MSNITKSLVAVCDILGFGNLCRRSEPEDIAKHSIGWFRKALHYSIHSDEFPQSTPSLIELCKQAQLGLALFSDTVFLYTIEDTDENCRILISSLAWLVFITMRRPDIRIRCGVAYGNVYIDEIEGIHVGAPFVEANDLQKIQKWSGGALTDSAVLRIPLFARDGRLADWPLVKYHVPIGKSEVKEMLAIDWTRSTHPNFRLPWKKNQIRPTPEEEEEKADICEKWLNTIRFHDDVCKRCHQSCLRL